MRKVYQHLAAHWDREVPYFKSVRERWLSILFTGLFVSAFLLFFQPFGVNNYDPAESITGRFALSILSFGLVIIVFFALAEFVIRPLVIRRITLGTLVLWIIFVLLLISSAIFLHYNLLGNWHDFSWGSYTGFIVNSTMMAVFPIVVIIFYVYQRSLHSTLQSLRIKVPAHADATQLVHFDSETAKDSITLRMDHVLYIEAQDNYAALHYLDNGAVRRHLLRITISRLEDQLSDTSFTRCHRSYLVNLSRVLKASGNIHRMELVLDGSDQPVPVSRSYVQEVRALLNAG